MPQPVHRFSLCFERGQADRCIFKSIKCLLLGTCINSCLNWHRSITGLVSQFDIKKQIAR